MTEKFRRLPEEEQAKVDGLLLQLPEGQRESVLAGIDEYLSGKMTEQQFQDRWTRLTSLRETGQP